MTKYDYNHKKAKEMLQERIDLESLNDTKNKITDQIDKGVNLSIYAQTMGKRLAGIGLNSEYLMEDIVIIVETIYDIFGEKKPDQCDMLFEEALDNILNGLMKDQFNSVIGKIEELYDL